ncbi:MAG TPA: ATP-binding cassette domain-containing protein [Candidatus Megaira endosymbiont of Nemacystus decipiens]|nr:ATP-binding cassette domain-containing protein [Candidatus Megaera endosymbiont of Nemacystus decipiens]
MRSKDFLIQCDRQHINKEQTESLMKLFKVYAKSIPSLSISSHAHMNSIIMLLVSLGWSGSAKNLLHSLPHNHKREIDLVDIINSMSYLGYLDHEMKLKLGDIDDRLMPCLFSSDEDGVTPKVLLSKKNNKITFFDSATQKIEEISADKEMFGRAHFFEKLTLEQIEKKKKTMKSAGVGWFSGVLFKFRPILRKIIIASTFINIFALAMPLFIMSVYDYVIGAKSTATLGLLVLGVLIAVTAESVLRVFRMKSVVWLGIRLDYIVSNAIFEKLLFLRAAMTEGAPISAQISRIKNFDSIRQFFAGPLFSVMIEIPFTIILFVVIWLISGPLVIIPIVVASCFIIILSLFYSKMHLSIKEGAFFGGERQEHEVETFIKIDSLHHNGMCNNWWSRYKEKLGQSIAKNFDVEFSSVIIENFAHAASMLSGVAVITFGVQLIWSKTITVGALVATMILIWRILGPMQTLCSVLPRLEQLRNSIRQINMLMNLEVEKEPLILSKPIDNLKGNVKLNNIGLRYNVKLEPLFIGLNIEAKPGEVIAITGPNGSGKSSLLKLINGLYHPQMGSVQIDDANIQQFDPVELRSYISYMPQMPNFFEGSIKDNLKIMNMLASDKEIKQALIDSCSIDQINELENGLNTMICGNHRPLEEGLKHSLNFARILLKDSNVVLLDELPNSLLNEGLGDSYKKFLENCRKKKKTVFFVNQRVDYLKLADRIIALRLSKTPLVIGKSEFSKKYGKS